MKIKKGTRVRTFTDSVFQETQKSLSGCVGTVYAYHDANNIEVIIKGIGTLQFSADELIVIDGEVPEWVQMMRKVARDIINFNKGRKDLTNKAAIKIFYGIMQKYGIKQGEWEGNGRVCNNPEWTICYQLWRQVFHGDREIMNLLGADVPEDLLAYGENPNSKNKK